MCIESEIKASLLTRCIFFEFFEQRGDMDF